MNPLRWGLLATGNIARAFAGGVQHSDTGVLVAAASRSLQKAQAFCQTFDIPTAHGSYQALLDDANVDAVYISTPHPMHAEWAIKAAEAGKHILVEKPIALNRSDAEAIIDAAEQHDVFLMEGFMYRCQPQIARLIECIQSGRIGEVQAIEASFSFRCGWNPDSRLLNRELGGGGILDVGGYPVSFARLIAGVAIGKPFADPHTVKAVGQITETGVDAYTAAVLQFEQGLIAQVATGVQLRMRNQALVYGTKGMITLPSPWLGAGREGGVSSLLIDTGGETETIPINTPQGLYALEADRVAAHIADRQAPSPAMSWADTVGNAATLDAWREQIGLTYPEDTAEGRPLTVSGRPLRAGKCIPQEAVPGLHKPVSRLVLGFDNQQTIPHTFVLNDAFFELGGNAFDTAHIYGGGSMEKLLGSWIRARGIRDQVVVIAKGAHTPNCYPEAIRRELLISLDRMQTDYADIYFMHRDNLEIPVGEFIDAINQLCDEGLIRGIFGGSNWTLDRVQAANDYARATGKRGFAGLSNNLSLARMEAPIWAGCVHIHDQQDREQLAALQLAHFAWSSQARGFFVPGRAAPDKHDEPQLVRCWYSEANFQRLARATELAAKHTCSPVNIAGAWVLAQPFPSFSLFGPRSLSELRSSVANLDIQLSREECAWLNLEA